MVTHARHHRRSTLVLLAVLSVGLGVAGCGGGNSVSVPPRSLTSLGNDAQEFQAAQKSLDLLERSASGDTPAAVSALDAPGTRVATDIVENAHTIGVRDLSLRYLSDATSEITSGPHGDGWVGDVDVSYRLAADDATTGMEVAFTFFPGPDGTARIAATGGHGERDALWLQGPIQVRSDARALLITATGEPLQRYWDLAQRAVRDVDRVIPPSGSTPARPLVFEVPRNEGQLEQLNHVPSGTYHLVAGVTDSVDGTYATSAPVHSFFNADLIGSESQQAAQVVVSHEATLQATRAPLASSPLWLREGFADYVALAHSGVPLRTADHNIVGIVRHGGPPARLPTEDDFDPTDTDLHHLNAVYEGSWLACRYIAQTHGEAALLSVYDALRKGTAVNTVFRHYLGVDLAAFTAQWRRYLSRLAES